MFQKVIYNAGAQTLSKAVTASATLIVTLLIGRALGPAGFGEFTKIFVFVGYFYTFADFGLNAIFIKLAKEKSEATLLKPLLGLRLILSSFLVAVAVSIAFFLPYDPVANIGFSPLVKTGIAIASFTIITQALFTTANAFFQKKLKYDLSAIAATLGALVILTSTIIVSITKASLLPYVFVYILGGLTYVLSSFFLIFKESRQLILPEFEKAIFQKLLRSSWPIGLALILNLIYFRIDVLILANVRSSEEVGIYGLAYQFFQAGLAIPIFFSNALYPLLNKIYSQNIDEFKKQVRSWIKLLSLFSAGLIILLFSISYLIPTIYDPRFTDSRLALQILSLGLPFFFISALLWHLLIIYDKQKYLISIYAAGAAFNIIANLIFIPSYGFLAASIITGVSEALILLLSIIVLRCKF